MRPKRRKITKEACLSHGPSRRETVIGGPAEGKCLTGLHPGPGFQLQFSQTGTCDLLRPSPRLAMKLCEKCKLEAVASAPGCQLD